MAKMYQLTHNGRPVCKPHPHRITCYIEALERGLVAKSGGMYWLIGAKISPAIKAKQEHHHVSD